MNCSVPKCLEKPPNSDAVFCVFHWRLLPLRIQEWIATSFRPGCDVGDAPHEFVLAVQRAVEIAKTEEDKMWRRPQLK